MGTTPHARFIWFDGKLVPWDEANVHVLTHTLHYGLGVFEGIRAYEQGNGGTAVFRLSDHLQRLERSAHILQIDLPFGRAEIMRATHELISANELRSCYLRHLAFLGVGAMGVLPRNNPVSLSICAWEWGAYLGEEGLERGIRCRVSSFTRQFPNSAMNKAKVSGNYVNSILAKREAVSLGCDEAILLDTTGMVAEGSGENLFLVRDGVLKTPPPANILEGITRDCVLQIAKSLGWEIRETPITRDELYIADEVFFTGTAAEITPVREIDDRAIGDGKRGPMTEQLQDIFFRTVRGEESDWNHWLEPVEVAVERAIG